MRPGIGDTSSAADGSRTGVALAVRLALGFAVLAFVLVLPARFGRLEPGAFLTLPVELPLVVLALCVLSGRARRIATGVVVGFSAALLFLKLADIGTSAAFQRPFNPVLDLSILVAGWHLLSGAVGLTQAVVAIAVAVLAWAGLVALLAWGLGGLGALPRPARRRFAIGAVVLCIGFGASLGLARPGGANGPVALAAVPYALERGRAIHRSVGELRAFAATIDDDPLVGLDRSRLFSALAGKDVYVLFVESYGRTVFTSPRYRAAIGERLAAVQDGVRDAGFTARSAWLTSPTVGGQSWLAHGALLSGLWTSDQARYDLMIASERESLNALFRAAGWHTLAAMPAITMDWPEAGYFGYDTVLAADDLGYAGQPFNWVTMPDQYTLSAVRERLAAIEAPVMAEVALISSHAPWTPVPTLIPWDAVGDGSIFDTQAASGDTPAEVWADPDRVREQYGRSIDYALETVGSYIARFGEDAVFVILGDHQPAAMLTDGDTNRDVPVHVVASDPAVLDRLGGSAWPEGTWTPGLTPDAGAPPLRMDAFRTGFTRAMSGPPAPEEQAPDDAVTEAPADEDAG